MRQPRWWRSSVNERSGAVGRNATCPCGSGRRFKACCGSVRGSNGAFAGELQSALALQESGRWSEAESLYRNVLRRAPDLADAVHMLGVVHLQAGNYVEALVRLHRAAELFAWQSAAAHHNLGLAIVALIAAREDPHTAALWEAYDGWRDRLAAHRGEGEPSVSVVLVPGDDAVEGALESVYGQSYRRIELVVVESGERETPRRLLARSPYAWRLHRARESDRPAELNAAIRESTGDFINVLMAGDRFAPTRIQTMVDSIARVGGEWGFSRAEAPPSDEPAAQPYLDDDVAARDTVGVSLLSGTATASASGLFFSRALFDAVEGFATLRCYDWDFCLRASLVAEPVYVPSAEYRHLPEPSGEASWRRNADPALEAFYDCAHRATSPANPFAPVPAVWGERFYALLLSRARAAALAPGVLRDIARRVAASRGVALS